jgi:hypothetical protein
MLLEIFWKYLVRIIQKRLSKVLVENKILKELNFTDFLEESTSSLIHIINNLIEDVKKKNKKIWIFLQYIKKAFNLVCIKSIKQFLIRIKASEILIYFVLKIFNRKKV